MKRGALKDLANTPTQIVCGWRLYGRDLSTLRDLAGVAIAIDLLTGECRARGSRLEPPLAIASELTQWVADSFERDRVPRAIVTQATSTLFARREEEALSIECDTTVETTSGTYESHGSTRWGWDDFSTE